MPLKKAKPFTISKTKDKFMSTPENTKTNTRF